MAARPVIINPIPIPAVHPTMTGIEDSTGTVMITVSTPAGIIMMRVAEVLMAAATPTVAVLMAAVDSMVVVAVSMREAVEAAMEEAVVVGMVASAVNQATAKLQIPTAQTPGKDQASRHHARGDC